MTLATFFGILITPATCKYAWHAGALLCGIVATSQLNAAWQNPLNTEETQTAASAVMSQYTNTGTAPFDTGNSTGSRTVNSAANLQHPLGVQVLLVELREQKNTADQAARIAEVFVFDYQQGVSELNLVDVESNLLLSTREIDSAHLPLSELEIEYSKTLIWNNTEFAERVQTEYENLISSISDEISPNAPDNLKTMVSIWVPNSNPERQSDPCVQSRCALISVFTEHNYNFSVEPVIDLMSGQIYLDLVR